MLYFSYHSPLSFANSPFGNELFVVFKKLTKKREVVMASLFYI